MPVSFGCRKVTGAVIRTSPSCRARRVRGVRRVRHIESLGAVVRVEDACKEAADAVGPGRDGGGRDDERERQGAERERNGERCESMGGIEEAGGKSHANSGDDGEEELGEALRRTE